MAYDSNASYDSAAAYDIGNPVSVAVTGIGTGEQFSTILVAEPRIITVTGIPTAEAFGAEAINIPGTIGIGGIPTTQAFGAITVTTAVATALPQVVQSIANNSIVGMTGVITFLSNVTNGNGIILATAVSNTASPSSVTDSAGNTYTEVIGSISAPGSVTIWYAPITAGGGTPISVTVNDGSTILMFLFLYEVSGINPTNPLDAPAAAATGSGLNPTSGPMLTTTYSNDFLIGVVRAPGVITAFEPGWTGTLGHGSSGYACEVLVTASAGVYAAIFTQGTSGTYNAAVASFAPRLLAPTTMSRPV